MPKVSQIEISYGMTSQPRGSYTSDEMSVRCLISYENDEQVDMLKEIKEHSGRLKLACHKRINAKVEDGK